MIAPRQTVTTTQTDTIKAHLMTGASISTWQAYESYQTTCLAQRVHDLRKIGMEIQSKSTVKNGKRFNLYWLEEKERARYVSGKVITPTDVRGTGDGVDARTLANNGVWVSNDYIDNLLSTLTTCAKNINLMAKFADVEDAEEGNKINNYSMEVSDIAMSVSQASSSVGPHPTSADIIGIWLTHEFLKQVKLSIDGSARSLGAMVIKSRLTDAGMNDGASESSMRLAEISASIEELITNE
ncbi:helix-turn-helix domain-containing protein [Psychrobacter sp. APC 3426]|uniref:helix-turn-helix domain-containing protein n=1 Tax=Psychrobacter sp. APC 3426 TaxID=3035177 RepID=UPI0025B34684|nr:helix-turn-helix domain-containing protein [Psychrobacter sp. APC 3426]MDN3397673.1 helix-turn-helix domain-containing protein [Psychrobacter sp. APC 3426]